VEVEARTPQLAFELAAAYARYAAQESGRLKRSLAGQRRVYLEARLSELDVELTRAGGRLRAFEERHHAVSLPDQARATLEADGALLGQLAMLETELAATRRYFTESSPEVRALRDRAGELRRQLQRLQSSGAALLPGGDALPALKQEYLRLTREQASLLAVSEALRRVYEQARVEEANPVPTFSILDDAVLPERPSRPPRALTVLLSTALALAGSLFHLDRRESAAGRATRNRGATDGADPAGTDPVEAVAPGRDAIRREAA
jgi:tyrosine-protein kinase Etk/Wzc